MGEIELKTCTNINSAQADSFFYNLSLVGREVLHEAVYNLSLKSNENYCLLLRTPDKLFTLFGPKVILSDLNPERKTTLVVIPEYFDIYIGTEYENSATMRLSLISSISSQIYDIMEELDLRCQLSQYGLFARDDLGVAYPLDSAYNIASQASNYKRLIFRRRYFLPFRDDFGDYDNALHIYRDLQMHYNFAKLDVRPEEAAELGFFIICSMSKVPDDYRNETEKLRNKEVGRYLIPKCHISNARRIGADIVKIIDREPMLERMPAMIAFINQVRKLNGFGSEEYLSKLILNNGLKKKIKITVGPRGLNAYDYEDRKELFFVHIMNNANYSMMKHRLIIDWLPPKASEKIRTEISIPKIFQVFSYIRDTVSLLTKRHKFMTIKRTTDVFVYEEPAKESVITLFDADIRIRKFIEDTERTKPVDLEVFGLGVVTSIENCVNNDNYTIDEKAKLKQVLNADFMKILFHKKPTETIGYILDEKTKTKIDIFKDVIFFIHDTADKMNITDTIYYLETCTEFLNVIQNTCASIKIDKEIQEIKKIVKKLHVIAIEADKIGEGISDKVDILTENLDKIIAFFTPVNKAIKEFEKKKERLSNSKNNKDKKSGKGKNHKKSNHKSIRLNKNHKNDNNNSNSDDDNSNDDDHDSDDDNDKEENCQKDQVLPKGQMTLISLLNTLNEIAEYVFDFNEEIRGNMVQTVSDILSFLIPSISIVRKLSENYNENQLLSQFFIFEKLFKDLNPFVSEVRRNMVETDRIISLFEDLTFLFSLLHTLLFPRSHKFYPGVFDYLFQIKKVIDSVQETTANLCEYPFVKDDNRITKKVSTFIETIKKEEKLLLNLIDGLTGNSLNEELRLKTVQSLHKISFKITQLMQLVGPYKEEIDASPYFSSAIDKLETTIFSLSPYNISKYSIENCSKMLQLLINKLEINNIDKSWIERFIVFSEKISEFAESLLVNPSNAIALIEVQQILIVVYKDMKSLRTFLAEYEGTVAESIDMAIPAFTNALCFPFISDEFDFVVAHLASLNKLHQSFAILINFIFEVQKLPIVVNATEIIKKLQKSCNDLPNIFTEIAKQRPIIALNPYAFEPYNQLMGTLDQLIIALIEIIHLSKVIDKIVLRPVLQQCIANTFKSILDFENSFQKMNIRPFREMPTTEMPKKYKKELNELVSSLKNSSFSAKTSLKDTMKKYADCIYSLVPLLEDDILLPSNRFGTRLMKIENYLRDIYIHFQNIPEFEKFDDADKRIVTILNRSKEYIIGKPPTCELVKDTLQNTIEKMNAFFNLTSEITIRKIVSEHISIWNGAFKSILLKLKFQPDDHISKKRILEIKELFLYFVRLVPVFPTDINIDLDKDVYVTMRNLYFHIEDTINLTRQFLEETKINLFVPDFEFSLSYNSEILAEISVNQSLILSEIVSDLLEQQIVRNSEILTGFVWGMKTFCFDTHKQMETDIGDISKQVNTARTVTLPLLLEFVENMYLFRNVMSNEKIYKAIDAFTYNFSRMIFLYGMPLEDVLDKEKEIEEKQNEVREIIRKIEEKREEMRRHEEEEEEMERQKLILGSQPALRKRSKASQERKNKKRRFSLFGLSKKSTESAITMPTLNDFVDPNSPNMVNHYTMKSSTNKRIAAAVKNNGIPGGSRQYESTSKLEVLKNIDFFDSENSPSNKDKKNYASSNNIDSNLIRTLPENDLTFQKDNDSTELSTNSGKISRKSKRRKESKRRSSSVTMQPSKLISEESNSIICFDSNDESNCSNYNKDNSRKRNKNNSRKNEKEKKDEKQEKDGKDKKDEKDEIYGKGEKDEKDEIDGKGEKDKIDNFSGNTFDDEIVDNNSLLQSTNKLSQRKNNHEIDYNKTKNINDTYSPKKSKTFLQSISNLFRRNKSRSISTKNDVFEDNYNDGEIYEKADQLQTNSHRENDDNYNSGTSFDYQNNLNSANNSSKIIGSNDLNTNNKSQFKSSYEESSMKKLESEINLSPSLVKSFPNNSNDIVYLNQNQNDVDLIDKENDFIENKSKEDEEEEEEEEEEIALSPLELSIQLLKFENDKNINENEKQEQKKLFNKLQRFLKNNDRKINEVRNNVENENNKENRLSDENEFRNEDENVYKSEEEESKNDNLKKKENKNVNNNEEEMNEDHDKNKKINSNENENIKVKQGQKDENHHVTKNEEFSNEGLKADSPFKNLAKYSSEKNISYLISFIEMNYQWKYQIFISAPSIITVFEKLDSLEKQFLSPMPDDTPVSKYASDFEILILKGIDFIPRLENSSIMSFIELSFQLWNSVINKNSDKTKKIFCDLKKSIEKAKKEDIIHSDEEKPHFEVLKMEIFNEAIQILMISSSIISAYIDSPHSIIFNSILTTNLYSSLIKSQANINKAIETIMIENKDDDSEMRKIKIQRQSSLNDSCKRLLTDINGEIKLFCIISLIYEVHMSTRNLCLFISSLNERKKPVANFALSSRLPLIIELPNPEEREEGKIIDDSSYIIQRHRKFKSYVKKLNKTLFVDTKLDCNAIEKRTKKIIKEGLKYTSAALRISIDSKSTAKKSGITTTAFRFISSLNVLCQTIRSLLLMTRTWYFESRRNSEQIIQVAKDLLRFCTTRDEEMPKSAYQDAASPFLHLKEKLESSLNELKEPNKMKESKDLNELNKKSESFSLSQSLNQQLLEVGANTANVIAATICFLESHKDEATSTEEDIIETATCLEAKLENWSSHVTDGGQVDPKQIMNAAEELVPIAMGLNNKFIVKSDDGQSIRDSIATIAKKSDNIALAAKTKLWELKEREEAELQRAKLLEEQEERKKAERAEVERQREAEKQRTKIVLRQLLDIESKVLNLRKKKETQAELVRNLRNI